MQEKVDCKFYKNGMCEKWSIDLKCCPNSIENFDDTFSICEIDETCEKSSILGNYFFMLTDEDIDALKAGKALFYIEVYGFFIAYRKKEDTP